MDKDICELSEQVSHIESTDAPALVGGSTLTGQHLAAYVGA
jgi:hypothetical protein